VLKVKIIKKNLNKQFFIYKTKQYLLVVGIEPTLVVLGLQLEVNDYVVICIYDIVVYLTKYQALYYMVYNGFLRFPDIYPMTSNCKPNTTNVVSILTTHMKCYDIQTSTQ
jgi:hypothetical protein